MVEKLPSLAAFFLKLVISTILLDNLSLPEDPLQSSSSLLLAYRLAGCLYQHSVVAHLDIDSMILLDA